MNASGCDLFGNAVQPELIVRLDRQCDRDKPCHDNLAIIRAGQGPHAAELRCAGCRLAPRLAPSHRSRLSRRDDNPLRRTAGTNRVA